MRTVWKYELKDVEEQWIEMPLHAKILTAQLQGDVIVLWALIEPEFIKEPRKFLIYDTGDMTTGLGMEYITTVQKHDETTSLTLKEMLPARVLHIFECVSTWY